MTKTTISGIVHTIESLFPGSIVGRYRRAKKQLKFNRQQKRYDRIIRRIRNRKGPVNVLFFALDSNTWKYDPLFQAMQKDPFFSPMVLVVPQVNKGRDFMLYQLKHGCDFYKSKGYPVLCAYNEVENSYVDVDSLKPDIIFFSNPYDGLVDDRYNLKHFVDKALTCYVNYGFAVTRYQFSCASLFHQSLWRYYIESDCACQLAKHYYPALNCVVTGYLTADVYSSIEEKGDDWKLKDKKLKRIIWAPHHTIEGQTGWIQLSTFLLYYNFMLQMAEEYKGKVQFVFKPHPLLKPALYGHSDWGKARTDAYYDQWNNGENTTFVNGDYEDLFKSSDAMIHDCGTFTIEYLYVNKPVMFLDTYDVQSQFNEFSKEAYKCHYIGKSEKDIKDFIEMVVIGGEDSYEEKRKSFYDEYLLPPNGITVAENIINDLKKALD